MNILITGGAGYIGSVLVPMLLDHRFDGAHPSVAVVDNFMHRQGPVLAACCANYRFRLERADVRDGNVMARWLTWCDVFIPLAAIVGMPACKADASSAQDINAGAVRAAIEQIADRGKRAIIPITNSGYGIGEPGKECTEDSPLRPISHYGRTKVAAERHVIEAGGLSLRLATVFGMSPRMRLDLLVNDFVHRALTDRSVVVFEGGFRRNYIHVQDVARAFILAIKNYDAMKGRPYNVGLSDANLSKLELCQRIREHLPQFNFLEAPIGEDPDKRDYIVSNARIEGAGFKPVFSLDVGIDELIKGLPMLRPSLAFGNA